LKLKDDKLLSNFAFNCNLRHYSEWSNSIHQALGENDEGVDAMKVAAFEVGRCRLTPR